MRGKHIVVLSITAVALLGFLVPEEGSGQEVCPPYATEGWDSGSPNGWITFAGSIITVPTSGGNPGGYLRAEHAGIIGTQTADPPWVGDYSAVPIASIMVDLKYLTADLIEPHVRFRRDAGTNGWWYVLEPLGTADGQWHHYEVPIDPTWSDAEAEAADWEEIPGPHVSFAETFSNVGAVIVAASTGASANVLGVDNFTLSPCMFADGFETGDTSAWSQAVP